MLVPAVLEHEGIGGISSSLSNGGPVSLNSSVNLNSLDDPTQIDPKVALYKLLYMLTNFHSILTHHGLDPEIISQVHLTYIFLMMNLDNIILITDLQASLLLHLRPQLEQLAQAEGHVPLVQRTADPV